MGIVVSEIIYFVQIVSQDFYSIISNDEDISKLKLQHLMIPHATSCRMYCSFDLSVSVYVSAIGVFVCCLLDIFCLGRACFNNENSQLHSLLYRTDTHAMCSNYHNSKCLHFLLFSQIKDIYCSKLLYKLFLIVLWIDSVHWQKWGYTYS